MNRIRTAIALLLAGSVFLCGGWTRGRVRPGVTLDGEAVGGLPLAEAVQTARARLAEKIEPLRIRTPRGIVSFDVSFTDDIPSLLRRAKKGETLVSSYERTWVDMEEELLGLCKRFARPAKNAEMSFSKDGFSFREERPGLACDYAALAESVRAALKEGGVAELTVREYLPAVTAETLRAHARKLSSFRTFFDGGNLPRRHNIALAGERISGTALPPGGEFSFNETVGKRTEENGFFTASVISDGEFVPGVGGGVCQASTTLFGAALRAGMEITESRAHSLSVGYVPPSLDAMVSETSDLKFVNPYEFPVYILMETGENSVRAEFFGTPDGRRYETESVVLSRFDPPPPLVEEGEEDRTLRAEKQGIVSESYLLVFDGNGKAVSRTRIRKDRYAAVRGKMIRAAVSEEEGTQPEQRPGSDAAGTDPEKRE